MMPLFVAVLTASLLGSLHCAGMCGGFVAFWAGGDSVGGRGQVRAHLAYNGGRLITYLGLGAVAGGVGRAIDLAGDAAGLQRAAAAMAGGLMVAWGGVALLRAFAVRLPQLPLPAFLQTAYGRVLQRLRGKPPLVRAAVIGLASTLLPCGWLYAFAVTAAGSGSWQGGAATMAAFWLGTLPVLVGIGAVVHRAAGPLRRHLPALTAFCVLAVGLVALTQHLQLPRIAPTAAPPSLHSALQRAEAQQRGGVKPPCCDENE